LFLAKKSASKRHFSLRSQRVSTRNKENNMLNKRISLIALGILSATQAMANDQAES
jgi:hypothetical protein